MRSGFCLIFAGLCGCAGGSRGKLIRVDTPSESELKQNWKDYTVYYKPRLAFVYKIKYDRKINGMNRWIEIDTPEMMARSKIRYLTRVKQILGQNDEMFGYLVHRADDLPNVKIIDQNTVELFYHYVANEGGP